MSEFSESYHLVTDQAADGVALLERAGVAGWVFPPTGGWCMVVPDADLRTEPDPALVAANQGTLLYYFNAEDHGWACALFVGADLVSTYQAEWTEEVEVDAGGLDVAALRRHLTPVADEAWPAVEAELVAELEADAIFSGLSNPGHRVATAFGLEGAEWMSGPYLASDPDEAEDAGAVRVG